MDELQRIQQRLTQLEEETSALRRKLEGHLAAVSSEPCACRENSYIELKWICRKGKRYGPYRYLRWHENGKKKSKYLGKEDSSSPTLLTETQ
ncbi:MAG: hypothetical protein AAF974_00095 [Cyanobacteria bacterium P01_E01_bin.34]